MKCYWYIFYHVFNDLLVSSYDGNRIKTNRQAEENENIWNSAMASSSVLNFNVGVLGHVDSGKTSLAKAISTVSSTAAFDKNPQSQVDFGVLYQNKLHRWMIRHYSWQFLPFICKFPKFQSYGVQCPVFYLERFFRMWTVSICIRRPFVDSDS